MWPLCDLTCFLRFERSNSGIVSQNWGSDGHFDVLNKFKSFWFKSYDADFHFRLELKERGFAFFCFCHYFWTNWDLDMSSTSKWASESQFCERQTYSWQKMAKMVIKWAFVSCYILRVSQAGARPPFTSEAITFEPINI